MVGFGCCDVVVVWWIVFFLDSFADEGVEGWCLHVDRLCPWKMLEWLVVGLFLFKWWYGFRLFTFDRASPFREDQLE